MKQDDRRVYVVGGNLVQYADAAALTTGLRTQYHCA